MWDATSTSAAKREIEGLADGSTPGNPPRIDSVMRAAMEERSFEERTWNATQLAQALKEHFGLEVTPEAVRQHLISMGYSWKRTRYATNKPPKPEQERKAREELEGFKKGRMRERSS